MRERVGIKYLCPFVTVVTGSVSTGKDMAEGGTECGTFYDRHNLRASHGTLLEVNERLGNRSGDRVPCHIHHTETQLAFAGVSRLEIGRTFDLVDIFLRDGFPGLVVGCPRVQPLFFKRVVFHELRGQFHEVTGYPVHGSRTVSTFAEDAV